MPERQGLMLHAPSMMNDYFHVKKESKEYQRWEQSLYDGNTVEFWLEERKIWIKGEVSSWFIDDGSGNAPGANAHFFMKWKDERGAWKLDLHAGLLVRLEAPTDEELIARSGWCEGVDWSDGYNGPAAPIHCSERGQRYVAPSGQKCWYCNKHKPEWVNESLDVEPELDLPEWDDFQHDLGEQPPAGEPF